MLAAFNHEPKNPLSNRVKSFVIKVIWVELRVLCSTVDSLVVAMTGESNSWELPGRLTDNIPLVPRLAGVYCPVVS